MTSGKAPLIDDQA